MRHAGLLGIDGADVCPACFPGGVGGYLALSSWTSMSPPPVIGGGPGSGSSQGATSLQAPFSQRTRVSPWHSS